MKTTIKLITILILTLSAVGVSARIALAAPPSNDTFPNATLVTLGFSEVLDTTEATTDTDDSLLNSSCGAPATRASVWYAIQGTDNGIVVNVSQSDYSAGVLVGAGSQGSLQTIACGPGVVGFFAEAGTTYYVLAIDDQYEGGGNGGNLSISFQEAPPPAALDIKVDRFGEFNSRSGTAPFQGHTPVPTLTSSKWMLRRVKLLAGLTSPVSAVSLTLALAMEHRTPGRPKSFHRTARSKAARRSHSTLRSRAAYLSALLDMSNR